MAGKILAATGGACCARRGSPDPAGSLTEGLLFLWRPSVGLCAGSGDPRTAHTRAACPTRGTIAPRGRLRIQFSAPRPAPPRRHKQARPTPSLVMLRALASVPYGPLAHPRLNPLATRGVAGIIGSRAGKSVEQCRNRQSRNNLWCIGAAYRRPLRQIAWGEPPSQVAFGQALRRSAGGARRTDSTFGGPWCVEKSKKSHTHSPPVGYHALRLCEGRGSGLLAMHHARRRLRACHPTGTRRSASVLWCGLRSINLPLRRGRGARTPGRRGTGPSAAADPRREAPAHRAAAFRWTSERSSRSRVGGPIR